MATGVRRLGREGRSRLLIYPLSLAIYCTSWTFFGSVGLASRTGFDFLAIYIGPILMIGLGYAADRAHRAARQGAEHHLDRRLHRRALRQEPGGGGDRRADRHRRHHSLHRAAAQGGVVARSAPSWRHSRPAPAPAQPVLGDIALFVALAMAAFAMLFGTRHIDATEHQDGLMLAIAAELLVKLVAFLAVGVFVTFVMFDGPAALFAEAMAAARHRRGADRASRSFGTVRGDDAAVARSRSCCCRASSTSRWSRTTAKREISARRLAVSALSRADQPVRGADRDRRPADLPARRASTATCSCWRCRSRRGSELLALVAFVGGLSAATAMVIVESVALAIMVSNDIVVPLVLQAARGADRPAAATSARCCSRCAGSRSSSILLLAYLYYRSAGDAQLASIGLLSFAAIAQLAPAFFGGLIWRRGTARGAHRRHDRRHPGLGLHAAAAELRRRRHRRRAAS